jgi:surface polysaccharide O-acyltransferase-like enzyme
MLPEHTESFARLGSRPAVDPAGDGQQPVAGDREHDSFLDLLRNISVLRVVFLHLVLRPPLLYFPQIQWLYPGMPEIFFVSGTLVVGSITRRGNGSVVRDRLRRVLFPYSVYVPFALVAMAVTDSRSAAPGATLSGRSALWFLIPFARPEGSTTRVILWSHLWFVTVFLWLTVCTPALVWLARRIGGWLLLAPLGVFAGAVAMNKLSGRRIPEEFIDLGQFGTFYVLGIIGATVGWGSFKQGTKSGTQMWSILALVFFGAGIVVAKWIEPIANKKPAELYSSRTAYLFIGAAWLCVAFAAHRPIVAWVRRHPLRWLRACSQRTFTLYLWGLPADAVGTSVGKKLMPNRLLAVPVYVTTSLVVLACAVIAFGWIEDVSARRKVRLFPAAA